LHDDQYTFLNHNSVLFRRMIIVSDKSCIENKNTNFVFSNLFSESSAVYEKIWQNIVERGRPQMTIRRIRFE